jgi:hypothetical protein
MAFRIESDLVVDLKRIDEGHQPSQQVLVDGMFAVGVEAGSIGELHDASKFVILRARRDVMTDQRLDEAGDLPLKGSDLPESVVFLLGGYLGSPAKGEGMNDHAASVPSTA